MRSLSWLVLALIALAGCPGNPGASECLSGITCPGGTKCAAAQAVCITNNCGDGIQQSGERCDDGNIIDGDGCSADCKSVEVCGDSVISTAADELCDDGNTTGGDGCSADCKSVEVCGNGIRDVNEVCDDSNTVPGDGCSGNCKSTEICGNGIVDINEKCDDMGTPGGCNDDCQGGIGCGDGAIDRDGNGMALEECDDGNPFEDDDCIACHLSSCGDTFVQAKGSRIEECDPGAAGETAACNIDCTSAGCGDGKLNSVLQEQCDDQNTEDHDACKNNCKLNVCGDGIDGGPNEACDTGGASATCDADCTSPMCGDGVVNMLFNEQCDSGGVNTATCDANCTIPFCGDGTVNTVAGEECDDMNSVDGDNCRTDCKFNVCGDSSVDTEAARIEACDDGNMMDEPSCPYGTQTCNTCNATCSVVVPRTGNVCGDKSIDMMHEACDDGNRQTETECPYGSATCMVCNATCSTETMLTNGKFCGDGIVSTVEGGEACDDHNVLACGTCDPTCNIFSSQEATGYIVAIDHADIADGETVTIHDGTTQAVFEFDNNNMSTGIRITLGMNDDAVDIAESLKDKINLASTGLNITATRSGNLVLLTHDIKTSQGNRTITDTVSNANFIVSGMSGGTGGDCAAGIGCRTNADCASGVCKTDKTCQ